MWVCVNFFLVLAVLKIFGFGSVVVCDFWIPGQKIRVPGGIVERFLRFWHRHFRQFVNMGLLEVTHHIQNRIEVIEVCF